MVVMQQKALRVAVLLFAVSLCACVSGGGGSTSMYKSISSPEKEFALLAHDSLDEPSLTVVIQSQYVESSEGYNHVNLEPISPVISDTFIKLFPKQAIRIIEVKDKNLFIDTAAPIDGVSGIYFYVTFISKDKYLFMDIHAKNFSTGHIYSWESRFDRPRPMDTASYSSDDPKYKSQGDILGAIRIQVERLIRNIYAWAS